jgi:hypothetical protein
VSDLIKKLESWAIKYQSLPLLQPYFYMYFVCSDENRIFPNHSQWPPTFHGAIYFLGCLSTHFIYISTSIYNTSLCTASLWEMMTSNLVRVLELRQWVEFLTNTNLTYVYIYLSLCVSERKLNLCTHFELWRQFLPERWLQWCYSKQRQIIRALSLFLCLLLCLPSTLSLPMMIILALSAAEGIN